MPFTVSQEKQKDKRFMFSTRNTKQKVLKYIIL